MTITVTGSGISHRALERAAQNTTQALEKLSTGKRVQRMKDDVVAVSLNAKVQSELAVYKMVLKELNVGKAMLETIDGGLHQTEEAIIRMKQLTIASKNADANVELLDAEMQALKTEVKRELEVLELSSPMKFSQIGDWYTVCNDETRNGLRICHIRFRITPDVEHLSDVFEYKWTIDKALQQLTVSIHNVSKDLDWEITSLGGGSYFIKYFSINQQTYDTSVGCSVSFDAADYNPDNLNPSESSSGTFSPLLTTYVPEGSITLSMKPDMYELNARSPSASVYKDHYNNEVEIYDPQRRNIPLSDVHLPQEAEPVDIPAIFQRICISNLSDGMTMKDFNGAQLQLISGYKGFPPFYFSMRLTLSDGTVFESDPMMVWEGSGSDSRFRSEDGRAFSLYFRACRENILKVFNDMFAGAEKALFDANPEIFKGNFEDWNFNRSFVSFTEDSPPIAIFGDPEAEPKTYRIMTSSYDAVEFEIPELSLKTLGIQNLVLNEAIKEGTVKTDPLGILDTALDHIAAARTTIANGMRRLDSAFTVVTYQVEGYAATSSALVDANIPEATSDLVSAQLAEQTSTFALQKSFESRKLITQLF